MIKHLYYICITDTTCLKILHVVFPRQCNCLYFRNRIYQSLLRLRVCRKINHIANKDPNRSFTARTFLYPLLHLFETAPFCNIKHEYGGSWAINVLVYVLVVAFLPRHIKVNNFVLVCVVYVVCCLYMKFSWLFILDNSTKSLRYSVQKCRFTNSWVANQRDLKPKMIVINFTTLMALSICYRCHHLLLLLSVSLNLARIRPNRHIYIVFVSCFHYPLVTNLLILFSKL